MPLFPPPSLLRWGDTYLQHTGRGVKEGRKGTGHTAGGRKRERERERETESIINHFSEVEGGSYSGREKERERERERGRGREGDGSIINHFSEVEGGSLAASCRAEVLVTAALVVSAAEMTGRSERGCEGMASGNIGPRSEVVAKPTVELTAGSSHDEVK